MPEAHAVWFPFANVRFQIRVENFADDAPVPRQAPVADAGMQAFGPGVEHQRGQGSQDFESVGYDIVPYAVSVERNSYREADACRITIPLTKMPFDPRVIRSATVQIFGGVLDPLEYREGFDSNQALKLPDFTANGVSNQLFAGFVDDWEVERGDHDVLQITARDVTSILVDAELPQNTLKGLPKASKLDDVIRAIIAQLPAAEGLRVVVELLNGDELPTLAEIKPPNWFDSKKTVKKGRKRSPNGSQKMYYWDMITDLCVAAGFVCFMRLPTLDDAGGNVAGRGIAARPELVISDPRTYYKDSIKFGGERVAPDTVRRFIYGINVDSLKLRRKFGGIKTPTIEVRSWDTRKGKALVGRFPRRTVNNKPATSGKGDREEVQVHLLRDIVGPGAQDRLDKAAASIYQQLSRGEFEVQIKTKALAALPRNVSPSEVTRSTTSTPANVDADIFAMQAGDPIIVGIDQANKELDRITTVTEFNKTLGPARSELMQKVAIRRDLADAIAIAMDSDFIQQEFRVQKAVMTWAHQSGWEFEVHAINYLDIRHAVELDELSVDVVKKSGSGNDLDPGRLNPRNPPPLPPRD